MRRQPLFYWIAWIALASPVHADALDSITNESQLDALLPHQESLDSLMNKITADPDNLDNYYAYAKAAEAMKQYEEAIWAYQTMITDDPRLDRVRLDLSLVYIAAGRYVDARKLLEDVLSRNPP